LAKTPRQSGYSWEKLFKESFDECFPDGFIYKLIDTHSLEGAKKSASAAGNQNWSKIIVPKVPSDWICIVDGVTIFVECKNTMNQSSFPLSNIKSHQFEFAAKIEAAGGKYFFAIRRQEPRNNECFLLTLNDFIRLGTKSGGRKSIKWELIRDDEWIIKCPQIKGSKFAIQALFD
jgi:recombination protein U